MAKADVVYLIGGTLAGSRLLDLALLTRTAVVMHWVGTDVTVAIEDLRRHAARTRYIERATHFCEVPWIQEELRRIGIEARIVQIAALDCPAPDGLRLPAAFSILSYVREGLEDFYGMDRLVRLARDLPDVEIRIAGISRSAAPLPPNVKLLGWMENMAEQYAGCVLFLRLPEHDGLSFSVLEALAAGRYVGYSCRWEGTTHIDSYGGLRGFVQGLYSDFGRGTLGVNRAGVEYVRRHFDRDDVLGTLAKRLREVGAS